MLLAIDVGNSNIKAALIIKNKIIESKHSIPDHPQLRSEDSFKMIKHFKRSTKPSLSSQDLYDWVKLHTHNFKIRSAIFSTVVPLLKDPIIDMLDRFQIPFHQLSYQLKTPITSLGQPASLLGSDLLSNAIAAHYLYQGSKIIINFGTALTFLSLDEYGDVKACSILTGLGASFRTLLNKAALINDIQLQEISNFSGNTTETAVQSGFTFGYLGAIKEITAHMSRDFQPSSPVTLIATGYETHLILSQLENTIFNSHLTLKGLYFSAIDNDLNPYL